MESFLNKKFGVNELIQIIVGIIEKSGTKLKGWAPFGRLQGQVFLTWDKKTPI